MTAPPADRLPRTPAGDRPAPASSRWRPSPGAACSSPLRSWRGPGPWRRGGAAAAACD